MRNTIRMLSLLLALMCILPSFALASTTWADAYAMMVVQEVNMERRKRGLNELVIDAELTRAARVRALEITEKCSHTRPDGSRWNTVSPSAKGENIARGQKTVDKVMAAWMSSDGHMRNILRTGYGSIGVACVKKGNIYHWVQLFGR